MTTGMGPIIYPVKDMARAKTIFRALLGVDPYVDEAYYAGFRVGDQEVGLDPNGHSQGITGAVGYWNVDDIEKSLQLLIDAGARVQQSAMDVGGGMLVARVTDADGNLLGLRQLP